LADEPCQADSFLGSVGDRDRLDCQLIDFRSEQFQQAIFDLAFIAKDQQAFNQVI
jgi:hypothetical protein